MKKTVLCSLTLLLAAPWSLAQTAKEKPAENLPTTVAPKTTHIEDDGDRITIARGKFSDTTKPGTLKIAVPYRKLEIKGVSGDQIIIISELDQKGKPRVDADGFRRLDDLATFDLVERGNGAELQANQSGAAKFKVYVPWNTNLLIKEPTGQHADVEIEETRGSVEIQGTTISKYSGGSIELEDVTGPVTINTGVDSVSFEIEQPLQNPVSITSQRNGVPIEFKLPENAAATFLIRAERLKLRTNFPKEKIRMITTTASEEMLVPLQTIHLNGGGTEIQVTASYESTITIKKND